MIRPNLLTRMSLWPVMVIISLIGVFSLGAVDVIDALAFKTDTLTVTGAASVGGLSTLTGGFDSTAARALVGKFTGTVQPSVVTGTQTDFVLNDSTTTLRWSNGGTPGNAVAFTGFKCGAADCSAADNGRVLWIESIPGASGDICTLVADATSTAANRIYTLTTLNIPLKTGAANGTAGALLQYDGTSLRWRVLFYVSILSFDNFQVGAFATTGLLTAGAGVNIAAGSLTFSGIAVQHIQPNGPAVTLSGCGTAPTINGSTEISGRITTGTTNTGCTVNWPTGYSTRPPACVCSTENPDIVFKCVPGNTNPTTSLVITYSANSNNVFDYICHATI